MTEARIHLWVVEYEHNGDECIIVVPGVDAEDAEVVARIRLGNLDRFPIVLETPRQATADDIIEHDIEMDEIERERSARECWQEQTW